jgi:PAS domain S-box-containing protein
LKVENSKTLLLVEDEALIALSKQKELIRYGYIVLLASTGEKSVQIIKENPDIDLILMDIDLGRGIDGTEAAEKILQIRNIPIVFLSSHIEPEIVEKTEKITSYGYVVKSSSITVLEASVKMAFKLFAENLKLQDELSKRKKTEKALRFSEEQYLLIDKASRDITIRKNAEKALRESCLLNQQIIDCSHEGIIVYGSDLRYKVWNPFMESLTGLKADEMLGKHPLEVLPFLKSAGVMDRLELALKGEIPDSAEFPFEIRGKSGWAKDTSTPIINEKGEIVGVIASVQDITENKKTMEALCQSEDRFRRLAENARDMIYRMSLPEGNYEYVSPASTEIFGYSPEEFINKPLLIKKIIHSDWYDYFDEQWSLLMADKISPSFEFQIIHGKSGETRWLNQRNVLVQNNEGQTVAIEGIVTDVTERKKYEQEIKRQLQEKEIILKEVHHRIKNNFASVVSLLNLQYHSVTNPDAHSALQDAIGRVKSMWLLYEKLLQTDDYRETSIKQYLMNLIDEIMKIFPRESEIKIETQIDDFQLDPKRMVPIGIIVNELLTNIYKYAFTSSASGLINVKVTENQDNIILTICDNGKGLPEDFDIDDSGGFGLMLVKILCQQINGNFIIETYNGTRSTLKFSI